jgi:hypothetical protein
MIKTTSGAILANSEIDEIMLQLEALSAETGSLRVFKIIEILMKDTTKAIKTENNG